MASVQFFKDYSWHNTPRTKTVGFNREAVIERLTGMRQEWQEAAEADGKTLAEVKVSVEEMLSDFCDLLELTPEETQSVLGPEFQEVIT